MATLSGFLSREKQMIMSKELLLEFVKLLLETSKYCKDKVKLFQKGFQLYDTLKHATGHCFSHTSTITHVTNYMLDWKPSRVVTVIKTITFTI